MKTLIFLIAGLMPLAGVSAGLRVAGSDLPGAECTAALEAFSKRESLPLTVEFKGSRSGFDELKAGTADLALVAFAPDEKLPVASFVTEVLAYRVAVVVAPEHIGVTQISFAQLDGFFGAGGPAGFTSWRDLGVTGSVAQLSVNAHVLEGAGADLSVDIFTHGALRVPRLKSSVMRHQAFATLKTRLETEEGGLAVLPYLPPAGSGLRALLVTKAEGEPAFGPTLENIHTGDYPLRLPLYVVYRRDALEKLRPLLTFLWSEEFARAIAQDPALMPVPASGRPVLR